jgi:hypothetical protein
MSNVISINQAKPHISGDAHCIGCGHDWVAVAPIGTSVIDCPECKGAKGIFVNLCCKLSEAHLTCSCGNDFLHITPGGFYCPKCGCNVLP